METITAALAYEGDAGSLELIDSLAASPVVSAILLAGRDLPDAASLAGAARGKVRRVGGGLLAGPQVSRLLDEAAADLV
jgi:hypothetical protein